jgi:hypothetical protein
MLKFTFNWVGLECGVLRIETLFKKNIISEQSFKKGDHLLDAGQSPLIV